MGAIIGGVVGGIVLLVVVILVALVAKRRSRSKANWINFGRTEYGDDLYRDIQTTSRFFSGLTRAWTVQATPSSSNETRLDY